MKHVAIVGGGAAGVLSAIALLRVASEGDTVTIFEPNPDLGRGLAYRGHDAAHVLNARAYQMSARDDRPDDFAVWLADHHAIPVDQAGATFAARTEYGAYLADSLARAKAASPARLLHVPSSVTAIEPGPPLVVHTGKGDFEMDAVVLAIGTLPSHVPSPFKPWKGDPNFIQDVYHPGALASIPLFDDVLILGSGLAAMDAVLTLVRQGHRLPIAMRSRSGLIPQAHRACKPAAPPEGLLTQRPVWKAVLRYLRAQGDEWRPALDGLRPHLPQVWAAMPAFEKRRFLRRLRPYWESHRHRLPEWIATIMGSLRTIGFLDVAPGVAQSVQRTVDSFLVGFPGGEVVRAHWVLNCTGPSLDLPHAKIPVVESLVESGVACYDDLRMGLDIDPVGRLDPFVPVWTIGALCRGVRWETTAIPEIRAQAAGMARAVFADHG